MCNDIILCWVFTWIPLESQIYSQFSKETNKKKFKVEEMETS